MEGICSCCVLCSCETCFCNTVVLFWCLLHNSHW